MTRRGATAGVWTVTEVAPEGSDGPRLIEITDGSGSFITKERAVDLMVCLAEFLGVKTLESGNPAPGVCGVKK